MHHSATRMPIAYSNADALIFIIHMHIRGVCVQPIPERELLYAILGRRL